MDSIIYLLCLLAVGFCFFLMKRAREPQKAYFIQVDIIQDVGGALRVEKVNWEMKRI